MCAFYLYSLDYNVLARKIFEILKFRFVRLLSSSHVAVFLHLSLYVCSVYNSSLLLFFTVRFYIGVFVYLCIFLLWTIVLHSKDIATATYSLSPFSSFVRSSCLCVFLFVSSSSLHFVILYSSLIQCMLCA